MDELGRLEDLPEDYRAALREQHLAPLWPSLRALLPPGLPARRTRPVHWRYAALRPLLLRAGELTPIEKAERRVLVLANPGHGPDSLQASAAIYLGLQLLLPGEWAPSHRHTPNAVRMVVEGEGAWTAVDGQKLAMQRGDLILTPTGLWHEHGHDGAQPVTWLDVLDLPLVHALETSYHQPGSRQPVHGDGAAPGYRQGGLLPVAGRLGPGASLGDEAHSSMPGSAAAHAAARYPLLRYPWAQTRAALLALAQELPADAAARLDYVNPATGESAQNILGYQALMLRPGQVLALPPRSPAAVFHLVDGAVQLALPGQRFELAAADTACVPGYTACRLANASRSQPAFLFMADESPLHRKLGLYEEREGPGAAG